MKGFTRHGSLAAPLFLLSATISLSSGAAFAQTVNAPCIVYVQPIDVCNSAGNLCAPVNNKGQSIISSGGGPNMPVGWFDPTTGANISQAILLAGLNCNASFLPLVRYNSAPNTNTSPAWNTDFRTLHVTACSSCPTGLTVPDLAVLAQQPHVSLTGTVPNPTTPLNTTPPLPPSGQCAVTNGVLQPPCVTLNQSATVLDWFLVNTIQNLVTPAGQTYGATWKVGANGIATALNAMVGNVGLGLPSRPDTFIHEALHAAGGDHGYTPPEVSPIGWGAGPYDPYGASNLNGGFVPVPGESPSIGECDSGYPACQANLMTAGGGAVSGVAVNLRTEPTLANALSMLTNGTADQLTTVAQQGPNLPVSQQTGMLASGFIGMVPNSMLTAAKPASSSASATTAMASVATKSMANSTSLTSGSSSSIIFTTTGPQPPETTNVVVIQLLSPFKFDPKNQFKTSQPNLLQDADYYPDADNDPNNPNAPYHIGAAYQACKATNAQCLIVELNPPGLGAGQTFQFTQGITKSGAPVTLQQLEGSVITFGLSNTSPTGTVTSSQLITTSELVFNGTIDTASSTTTSPMLPPPVLGNPGAFGGTGGMPCTPVYDANSNLICLDPTAYGTVDTNPCGEGGQPPTLTCP